MGYSTTLSVSRLYSVGWSDDCLIGKNVEESGRNLTEFILWNLIRKSEEKAERPRSGEPVSPTIFE
jgi:hypothetical protein